MIPSSSRLLDKNKNREQTSQVACSRSEVVWFGGVWSALFQASMSPRIYGLYSLKLKCMNYRDWRLSQNNRILMLTLDSHLVTSTLASTASERTFGEPQLAIESAGKLCHNGASLSLISLTCAMPHASATLCLWSHGSLKPEQKYSNYSPA